MKLDVVWEALVALLVVSGKGLCSREPTGFRPALGAAIPRQAAVMACRWLGSRQH